ncbi:MAG: Ca-activated chloride channel family protein [Paracoccaceae bacterium]|jgi:Ca-activated chloride channel family protein
MLSLAFPWALILLPAPLLIWRFLPPYRDQVSAIRIPFFRTVTQAAGLQARQGAVILRRGRFQMGAAILIWTLLVLALARPERLGEPVVIETAARDMVLALDISGSMDERDFIAADGTRMQRLEAVKAVMHQFITERDGDRIALIIFGTKAFVQAPFTEDLQSLAGFLDQTVVGMAGPNTALGDAIGLSIRTFEASEVDQRLMILLSDGADTSSRMTPVNAAALAADRGVTIYTIGVGDPQGSGEDRVDLGALEDIAARTKGQFFYASDEAALNEVYKRIDSQNPRKVETTSFRPTEDLTYIPMVLALFLVLLSVAVLHLTRRRPVVAP